MRFVQGSESDTLSLVCKRWGQRLGETEREAGGSQVLGLLLRCMSSHNCCIQFGFFAFELRTVDCERDHIMYWIVCTQLLKP